MKYKKKFSRQLKMGLRCDGMSIPEVCGEWGISRTTYYNWIDQYPEFAEAHEIGNRDCASWWYKLTRDAASGKVKANAGIICFAMKNVEGVGWADKSEVKSSNSQEIKTININVLPPKDGGMVIDGQETFAEIEHTEE